LQVPPALSSILQGSFSGPNYFVITNRPTYPDARSVFAVADLLLVHYYGPRYVWNKIYYMLWCYIYSECFSHGGGEGTCG